MIKSGDNNSRPLTHQGSRGQVLSVISNSSQPGTDFHNPTFESSPDIYTHPLKEINAFEIIPTSLDIENLTRQTDTEAQTQHDQQRTDLLASPRSQHTHNTDVADVISQSVRPGASPQPLIDSLRKELQTLSNKKVSTQSTVSLDSNRHLFTNSTPMNNRSFPNGFETKQRRRPRDRDNY